VTDTEAKIARANAMRQWAEGDGGLFEVFSAIEGQYIEEWRQSDLEDVPAREAAWHRLRALGDLRMMCEAVIQEGKDAVLIAARQQERKQRHV
jgi:hypothetical protein